MKTRDLRSIVLLAGTALAAPAPQWDTDWKYPNEADPASTTSAIQPGTVSSSLSPTSTRPSSTGPIVTSSTSTTYPKSSTQDNSKSSEYPFTYLLAFGDELSDNGNGSYAHSITGSPANVYGYGTWTNGPVAVSYLSDLLSTPLTDYAYGGCCGGGSFGASLSNTYTKSPAGAPSLQDQVSNFTGSGSVHATSSLGFIWVGENDLSEHTDAFWQGDPHNSDFASNYSAYTRQAVSDLIDVGVPYVLVANIYPKHIAPVTAKYLCGTSTSCVETWGNIISAANSQLEADLSAQFGDKVIYYDSFGFITDLTSNASNYGFSAPLTNFCDGMGDTTWNECTGQGGLAAEQTATTDAEDGWMGSGRGWDTYFWMNFIQPTTRVHALVAGDMKKTIDAHFGL